MTAVAKTALLLWLMASTGCVTGRPYVFAPIKFDVAIFDHVTKQPIAHARVSVEATGRHTGRTFRWDGFATDIHGQCQVQTPSRTTWIGGSEAFAGGFSRTIAISADGYESREIDERYYGKNAPAGFLDYAEAAPYRVELYPVVTGLGGRRAVFGDYSAAEVEAARAAIARMHFPEKEGTVRRLLPRPVSLLPIAVIESLPDSENHGRNGGDIIEYWLNRDFVVRVATADYEEGKPRREQWAVLLSRAERAGFSRPVY